MNHDYLYESAEVAENREVLPGYRRITVRSAGIAAAARPGQFVMVRGWESQADPLLPRPFDIAAADPEAGTVTVIVKIAGRGTRLLAECGPCSVPGGAAGSGAGGRTESSSGDRTEIGSAGLAAGSLRIAGPLGKPIPEPYPNPLGLLVRGVGSAAVTFLAARAAAAGVRVIAVLSASTANRLIGKEELLASGAELHVATDDGSEGYHGNGTDLMDRLVAGERIDASGQAASSERIAAVYTCGSKRFARHVRSLEEAGVCAGFMFLEGYMACGRGDCHGCAVRKRDGSGYALVCRDGPVFPVSEVEIE